MFLAALWYEGCRFLMVAPVWLYDHRSTNLFANFGMIWNFRTEKSRIFFLETDRNTWCLIATSQSAALNYVNWGPSRFRSVIEYVTLMKVEFRLYDWRVYEIPLIRIRHYLGVINVSLSGRGQSLIELSALPFRYLYVFNFACGNPCVCQQNVAINTGKWNGRSLWN